MFLLRSIIIPNLSVVSQMVHAYHRKHKHINKLNLKKITQKNLLELLIYLRSCGCLSL